MSGVYLLPSILSQLFGAIASGKLGRCTALQASVDADDPQWESWATTFHGACSVLVLPRLAMASYLRSTRTLQQASGLDTRSSWELAGESECKW